MTENPEHRPSKKVLFVAPAELPSEPLSNKLRDVLDTPEMYKVALTIENIIEQVFATRTYPFALREKELIEFLGKNAECSGRNTSWPVYGKVSE